MMHFCLPVVQANIDALSISWAPGSIDVLRVRASKQAPVNTHPHKPWKFAF